jgi:hypothetical protein
MRCVAYLASACCLPLLVAAASCGNESPADTPPGTTDAGDGSLAVGPDDATSEPTAEAGPSPDQAFARFCKGQPWNASLTPLTVDKLGGEYKGVLKGPDPDNPDTPFESGTLELMKTVAPHPVHVKTLRANFIGTGKARIRLTTTLGRSYPGPYPDMNDTSMDLMPPVEIEVKEAKADEWLELDVSDQGVFLQPTQHYTLIYEHLEGAPYLAVETLQPGEHSRALLLLPADSMAYGLGDYNYRLELTGDAFCAWAEEQRLFGLSPGQPFADPASARVAVADLNGDGHLDVITNAPHPDDPAVSQPFAWWGDGKGGFTAAASDPFAAARNSTMLIFADLDNDGDQDAFAARYVGINNDGDAYEIEGNPPDCNDADAKVRPKATENLTNGYDDDCDGIADDGTSTADADGDGSSIADGDCDDTRKEVYPGAPELLDGRDNDCDLKVDEDYVNLILLNDGTGNFTVLPSSGVEYLDPATAGGFSDANGDGKLDLYYGNWLKHYPNDPAVQDRYFEGVGDGTMLERLSGAGLQLPKAFSCYGVNWNDYNNDGWPDIFVGNYHMYANQLWQNQGDGTFKDVAGAAGVAYDDIPTEYAPLPGGHTYGSDWGDLDNDGDLDGYVTNLAHPRNWPWGDPSMFVLNQGAPDFSFVNKLQESGFIYDEGDVNVAFGDFDNDMDLDVAVASLYTGHYSRLYRNEGNGTFVDVTYETHTAVHDCVSVVWADVDEDGDLDLFYADRAGAPYVHLFVNRVGNQANWVQLDLQGVTSNRDAVGARVTLTAGGVTQIRDVTGGGGQSNVQAPHTAHFGLAANTAVEAVTVRWVGGATETITGVQANRRMRIVEGSGTAQ